MSIPPTNPGIARTFQEHVATGLPTGWTFKTPDQQDQARHTTDSDLVTWLVIKTP
jgi:hypothetical protein